MVLRGSFVIKSWTVLIMLSMLITLSSASDWLEGGYVGSGNYGEVRQYFTDPIFYSKGGSYTSSDPAVRQMQESMDRQSTVSLGSLAKTSTIGSQAATTVQSGAAGNWRLVLSDGRVIDLSLFQSGSRVFGGGRITSGQSVSGALASGTLSGYRLQLDVVPASGSELYALNMDISRLYLPGTYTAYGAYTTAKTGTLTVSRVA
jgi:hypothetical protein